MAPLTVFISDNNETRNYKRSKNQESNCKPTGGDEQCKNTASIEQDDIIIDFNIVYPSDCEIKVNIGLGRVIV